MILNNYEGIEVEDIYLAVYIEDVEDNTWRDNEEDVMEWLNENKLDYDFVENPIDNLVLICLKEAREDVEVLSDLYIKASEHFSKVEINFDLESFNEDGNKCIECTLEEFKKLL